MKVYSSIMQHSVLYMDIAIHPVLVRTVNTVDLLKEVC